MIRVNFKKQKTLNYLGDNLYLV